MARSALRRRLAARAFAVTRTANHWAIGQAARAALTVMRRLPFDRACAFAERAARRIGPLFGRHRVAVENLRRAFPEKSEAEIQALASDMWGQMARLAAEYVFLGEIFDFDPARPGAGRVEVEGAEVFQRLAGEKKPRIIFTAHCGSFELLPVAAAAYGLDVTALFREPNNPYVARFVFSTRRINAGNLLASRAGAAFALSAVLDGGGNIGLLVDQRFRGGVPTTFFGQPCDTNPLLGMLARQHDCDVYPARCVRLPGGRFRLEIGNKLDLPRDAAGRVDVAGATQLVTSVVEAWVREHPAQWMWFHKRWARSPGRQRRRWTNAATAGS